MGVNPLPNIGFNPLLMMNPHMRMPIPVNSPMGMNMQHRMMGHQNLPRSPFIRTPGSGMIWLGMILIQKIFLNDG